MKILLDKQTEEQIHQCVNLLKDLLGKDLLGVYVYGSAVINGLQKYSDLDLFVVSSRSISPEEKTKLIENLLTLSGNYKLGLKRPIEMTVVVKSEVNPWRYPPRFDFQYGDWLRSEFESGNFEPWKTKEMPDIALLITQVLLANKIVWGESAEQLLCKVPYRDFMRATIESLDGLIADLNSDTRNVLLTLARIWCVLTTDQIRSKSEAATWVINRLPKEYQCIMKHAKAIYLGDENENWNPLEKLIQPCVDFIMTQITQQISFIDFSNDKNKTITYFVI